MNKLITLTRKSIQAVKLASQEIDREALNRAKKQLKNQGYAALELGISIKNGSFQDFLDKVACIKEQYHYAKHEACPFFNLSVEKGVYKDLKVIQADDVLFFNLGVHPKYASAALVLFQGATEPTIVVNSGFYDLPKEYQEALLAHEYGHHALGHLRKANAGVRMLSDELEADAYAKAQGYDIEGTLRYLERTNPILKNQREISVRITALKGDI